MKQKIKDIIIKNRIEILVFSLYFIYISIFKLIVLINYGTFRIGSEGAYDIDIYYGMSQDITSVFKQKVMAPFCYRIFYPLLAYLLPFDPTFTFSLITFTSFYLMGIILYYTLRLHLSKIYSAGGLGFLCLFMIASEEFIMIPFYLVYIIDPLVFFFFICCFYAILTSNKRLYAIFLFLGTLTKESVLFTIPVFILCNLYNEYETIKLKKILNSLYRNVRFILPSILMLIILRLIITPSLVRDHPAFYEFYGNNEYLTLGFIITIIQKQFDDPLALLLGCTFLTWSISFIFFIFNTKKNLMNWIKIYGIFMCCVYSQVLIGYHKPRLLLIAFYPMIFFSVLGFKEVVDYLLEQQKQGEILFFKPNEKKLEIKIKDLHNI